MGEIPKTIEIKWGDCTDVLYVYVCTACDKTFAVGAELAEQMPICPICGKRELVFLIEEYT